VQYLLLSNPQICITYPRVVLYSTSTLRWASRHSVTAIHLPQVAKISYDSRRYLEVNRWHTMKEKGHSWTTNVLGINQITSSHSLHRRWSETKRRLSPDYMGIWLTSCDWSKLEESTTTNTWYPRLYKRALVSSLLSFKRHPTSSRSNNQALSLEL